MVDSGAFAQVRSFRLASKPLFVYPPHVRTELAWPSICKPVQFLNDQTVRSLSSLDLLFPPPLSNNSTARLSQEFAGTASRPSSKPAATSTTTLWGGTSAATPQGVTASPLPTTPLLSVRTRVTTPRAMVSLVYSLSTRPVPRPRPQPRPPTRPRPHPRPLTRPPRPLTRHPRPVPRVSSSGCSPIARLIGIHSRSVWRKDSAFFEACSMGKES
jgi:hypothetical protein